MKGVEEGDEVEKNEGAFGAKEQGDKNEEEEEEEDPEEDVPRKRCLLSLDLWMWTQMRIIYSTWRSSNIVSSTLPSTVVRRLLSNPPTTHNSSLLMPT
ncbi:hypothetical protein PIB30_094978, partial [Stylosanthes scabra]|nr:hypothetical protein [Stylosanthes scabra]